MSKLKAKDHPILAQLARSGIGLRINIRTHPIIEEFMQRAIGTPDPSSRAVEEYGRHWEPARGESKKELLVYDIPKELTGVFDVGGGFSYRLDRPGMGIFCATTSDRPLDSSSRTLNLSFLRLVGTSAEEGVTFHIPGVYSDDAFDILDRGITAATREIYSQFMKPIKIEIVLEVQGDEVRRERIVGVPLPPEAEGEAA